MKRSGPLYTLLSGLLLALFMLSLNATTGTGSSAYESPSTSPLPPRSPQPPKPEPTPPRSTPKPTSKPPKPPAKSDYAGRTDDDTSTVAVSLRDGRAIAYVCDGRDTESWLKGDVEDDGSMRLTGKHGAKLNGTLKGDRIRGTVDVDDGRKDFTADKTVKPSGLYRATAQVRGARLDGGWIVLPDGSQVGVLNRDGEPGPAPRLDPRTGAVRTDGGTLTARPVEP